MTSTTSSAGAALTVTPVNFSTLKTVSADARHGGTRCGNPSCGRTWPVGATACPACGASDRTVMAVLFAGATVSVSRVERRFDELGLQLRWSELVNGPDSKRMWIVRVLDSSGRQVATAGHEDAESALLEVAEILLPPAAGLDGDRKP